MNRLISNYIIMLYISQNLKYRNGSIIFSNVLEFITLLCDIGRKKEVCRIIYGIRDASTKETKKVILNGKFLVI